MTTIHQRALSHYAKVAQAARLEVTSPGRRKEVMQHLLAAIAPTQAICNSLSTIDVETGFIVGNDTGVSMTVFVDGVSYTVRCTPTVG